MKGAGNFSLPQESNAGARWPRSRTPRFLASLRPRSAGAAHMSGREMRIYYPYLLFRNLRSSSARPVTAALPKYSPTAAASQSAVLACVLSRRGANNSLLRGALCFHFSAALLANQRQLCDTHRSRVAESIIDERREKGNKRSAL
jgi:hypothetical protein